MKILEVFSISGLNWRNLKSVSHPCFDCVAGKSLMLRVAEMVPRHPGRTKKQEPASTSAGPSNKSGKGGKKKR